MSMTREEAIKRIDEQYKICEEFYYLSANPEKDYPGVMSYMEALAVAISALRPVSREQVEKVWRGEWKHYLPPLGAGDVQCRCTRCGRTPDVETPFCAWCGAPMTDEAVQTVMERLEALHSETKTD